MKAYNTKKTLVSILLLPLLEVTRLLVALIPRRRNVWVFGSYVNSFTDNSKYLYTYVTEKHPEIRAAWITSNPDVILQIRAAGGRAYLRWSVAGIYHAVTAKYWFVSAYVSDINVHLSRGASLINLWHGIPLKKIEFDIENGPLARCFQKPTFVERFVTAAHLFRRPQWVLSTSDYVTSVSFASAFRIPSERCLSFGYPRLDPFYWDASTRTAWLNKWGSRSLSQLIDKLQGFDDVVVYMPTWRDSNPEFLSTSGIDFERLNADLKPKNALLILKLHVATPSHVLEPLAGLSNIHIMDSRDDIYPLLPLSQALVTDYSSIYLDYLLLNRPICFFVFDIEKYLSESRGFYHDFRKFSPGVKALNGNEVADFIVGPREDSFGGERGALADTLHEVHEGSACRKIVEYFKAR
jgi:CDP-glycerol glycerophosphotransferase (TagB/SpsB family)